MQTKEQRIEFLLAELERREMNVKDASVFLGCSRTAAHKYLHELHEGREIYISEWRNIRGMVAFYRAGGQDDVPVPAGRIAKGHCLDKPNSPRAAEVRLFRDALVEAFFGPATLRSAAR